MKCVYIECGCGSGSVQRLGFYPGWRGLSGGTGIGQAPNFGGRGLAFWGQRRPRKLTGLVARAVFLAGESPASFCLASVGTVRASGAAITMRQYNRLILREVPAMMRSITIGGFLFLFAGSITAAVNARRQAEQRSQTKPAVTSAEQERMLATGKKTFVERCASCHDERGGKPLKTGLPLNERGLSTDVIARAVNGRLRDRTEDERRAVTLYIASFMKAKGG